MIEQLDYNLLFHWFVGLGMDDAVWESSALFKNRDRLLTSEIVQQLFPVAVQLARASSRTSTSL